MKSTIEKVGSLERRLNIEVPAAVVMSTFDRAFKSLQKDAHIKGFRQGKAPLATLRSLYGDRVKQDVAQELIQQHYFKALQEHALNPVSYPEFDFEIPLEDKDFAFTANFEVRPEVAVKKFEGLEVQTEKFEVDEKRVDQIIDNIRSAHAEWVDILENRPAQIGDMATLDFKGTIDGKPLENGAGTDFPLELGSNRFIPGFEDGVVGMSIGQTRNVETRFPETYHVADIAGKAVIFEVTLKGLKKKVLPEMTPEFLSSKMGGIESEEKLRESIRNDMIDSDKKRIETDLKNRLLRALVKANPVEVPNSLLKEQKEALVEDMKKRLTSQGLSPEDFADYTQKWDADFDTTAREMVQSGFLIDALATQQNLSANEEDFQKKYEEYAQQTGLEIEKIRDFYSRPEQMQKLSYMITEEKVIALLMKSAKIKEVEKSKLTEPA